MTFFEPQAQFPQKMPNLRQTETNTSLAVQLLLHFSQRQIGLLNKPGSHLLLCLGIGMRLAARMMRQALGLAGALARCGNLLCPTHAHKKTGSQFLKCALALIVGIKQLATQIIPIGVSHMSIAAETRQNLSRLYPKML